MAQSNRHEGSSFDDFLKKTGDYEEASAHAMKRVLSEQLEESMAATPIKKARMADLDQG